MKITKPTMRISDVCASESTRYAINGVHLERKGDTCTMRATDGRRALRVSWEDDDDGTSDGTQKRDFSCIVGKKDLASIGKMTTGVDALAYLDESKINGSPNVPLSFRIIGGRNHSNELAVGRMDGNFPKVDDVMPDRADMDCVRIAINPLMMAGMMKAIAAMVDIEHKGCTLSIPMDKYDGNHPIILSAQGADGRDIRGVIMPIHIDSERQDARKLYGLLRRFATQVLTDGLYITETHDAATINTLKSMLGADIPDSDDSGEGADDE